MNQDRYTLCKVIIMGGQVLAFLIKNKIPFWFSAFASLMALLSAYGAEHFFGLKPCELCHYQRYAFLLLLAVSVVCLSGGFVKNPLKRFWALVLLAILFAGNGGIATFQVLVEQKVIPAPKVCRIKKATTLEELRAQIEAGPPVSCDKVAWSLWGLSMAGYGALYNFMMVFYLMVCLYYSPRKVKR